MMKRLAFLVSFFIFIMIGIVCSMRIFQVVAGITAAMLAVRDALNGHFEWAVVIGAFLFIKIALSVTVARITLPTTNEKNDQEQAVFLAALFRVFLAVSACTAWAYAGVELQRGRPEWGIVVAVYTVATVVLNLIGSDESVD